MNLRPGHDIARAAAKRRKERKPPRWWWLVMLGLGFLSLCLVRC